MTQVPKLSCLKEKLQKQIGGYLERIQDRNSELRWCRKVDVAK
jgi:hypothetical protein